MRKVKPAALETLKTLRETMMHRVDMDAPLNPDVQSHPSWVTEELIQATLKVWQPYYDAPLTRDDAIGMILSAGRLFGALSRENGS